LTGEVLAKPTVFKDESPLSIEYVPARLPHREDQLRFLAQLYRFAVERPGTMSQRALITGAIGTGKTVLSQRFGIDLMKSAKSRGIDLRYIHVNCRECKGRLFLILKRIMGQLMLKFPERGFSSEEILQKIISFLDNKNVYLLLALDELESLIKAEGATPLYSLTRLQESRLSAPARLSLICILRELEFLKRLDMGTLSTLQHNIIKLEEYSREQLKNILEDRVKLAFKDGAIPQDTIEFIADLASETGDARYAIELLWRSGKYADLRGADEVSPEDVRKAVESVYPKLREENVKALPLHEKLILLAISRTLSQSRLAYATMGEIEKAYNIVCEEYGEKSRAHTQIWKYVGELEATGIISTRRSSKGLRGKTTLISLPAVPASAIIKLLESSLKP
jgi:cell division control protein 6